MPLLTDDQNRMSRAAAVADRQQVHDLCVASYSDDEQTVAHLLRSGCPPDGMASFGNVHGYTALTASCGFSRGIAVASLLVEHGASVNLTNSYGRTPLMCSVINSNAAAAELLLEWGACLEQRHKNQMTALDYATLAVAESATARRDDV